jgi:hypothetical protein
MSFDAIRSLVGKMSDQLQILQQKQFIFGFENIAKKFTSMPNLEVAPNLNFSSLIEEVGKTSTEAGTVLLSEGAPVAVIFNMEQMSLVNKVINFIPAVVQNMKQALNSRIAYADELKKWSVEVLDAAGSVISIVPVFITVGAILAVAGALWIGTEINNKDIKSRAKYLVPGFFLGAGLGMLAFSGFGAQMASTGCLNLAKKMSSVPV